LQIAQVSDGFSAFFLECLRGLIAAVFIGP